MRHSRRSGRSQIVSAINITSLTDVALVLLIIFLITATFLGTEEGVEVNLPGAASGAPREDVGAIMVVVTQEGRVVMDGVEIAVPQLVPAFEERAATGANRVVIRGDRSSSYEAVFMVMDAARVAGLRDIALATRSVDVASGGQP
ncbi:MAG: biopolymer transporter ExbD [Armatimonadetes bacterium]|nr:biopolymer transporter ExbD [Armatimonadota bacterium]MDI9601783.1 biopolymer transporter ExbD [Acidobacteriota bacterium]NLN89003.1 biopolymer transporter ExbD [candidate division WS1 bacterium]